MSILRRVLASCLLLCASVGGLSAQDDSCTIHYEALSGGVTAGVSDASGALTLAYDQGAVDDLVHGDSLDDVSPPFAPPGGWFVALSNPSGSDQFWGRSDSRLTDPAPGTQTVFNLRLFPRFAETAIDSVHLGWNGSCFTPPNVTLLSLTSCDTSTTVIPNMRDVPDVGIGRSSSLAWNDDEVCLSITAKDDLLASVKLLLEGPYAGGKMAVIEAHESAIPLTQPFSDPSFDSTPLDFDSPQSVTSLPDSTIDWLLVSLRGGTTAQSTSPTSKHAVLLLADGRVVEPDGSPLSFPGIAPGGYRLVARHRNHLAVMSADTLDLTDGVGAWDFTTALAQAHSEGGTPMASLGEGAFGLFAGEGTTDGIVTAPDFNLWNVETTAGATGYRPPDYNLDGLVTAPDFNLWNANTTAGASSQVPD